MKIAGTVRLALSAAALLLVGCAAVGAQGLRAAPDSELARARAALVAATEQYKASTRELISLREEQVARAERAHEKLRLLVGEGLVARREFEESSQSLTHVRAALEELRGRLGDADRVIAEVAAAEEAEEMARSQPAPTVRKLLRTTSAYSPTAVIIRHTGAAHWTLASLSGVQTFFTSTFGRTLPTSAVGQTLTHDRLGFDHRHAVDVALHPDSPEGRALINYLRSQSIPFIAFRAAVHGSATGPHIHIGLPSHRF